MQGMKQQGAENKRQRLLLGFALLSCGGKDVPKPTIVKIPTTQPVISSPLVIDLDQDGTKEIVFGSWDGNLRVVDSAGKDKPGWPFFVEKGFFGSPTAVDFDQDGKLEIVLGADTGNLYVFYYDGRVFPGWPKKIGETIWSSPSIYWGLANTPLIAIASDHAAYLFRADGTLAPGWPQPIENWADATFAYHKDTLVLTSLTRWEETRGRVYAWRDNGEPLPGFPLTIEKDIDSSPTLFDLNKDGSFEIIFGDDEGLIHAIQSKDAKEATGWPFPTKDTVESSASVADLNGDGEKEIVIGSWDHRLYVLDTKGQPLAGFPFEAKDQIIAQAALVDINQDQKIEIIVGSKDGFLYILNHDGSQAPMSPIQLGGPSFSSPWVGDLSGSGSLSIVVGASDGLYIIGEIGKAGASPWPMFRKEPWHSGGVE
jgi:hypothetical protein